MNDFERSAIALATLALLHGCGGGGGGSAGTLSDGGSVAGTTGSATATNPGIGIDRSGVAIGPITTFGSVVVNGVRYDTSSATILDDDQGIDESALAVGDVVRIEGTIDDSGTTGTATRVVYDVDVEGPIGTIDEAAGQLVVLGRTVLVDRGTVFSMDVPGRTLAGLAVGDRIEATGLLAADGALLATRIERSGDDDLEVEGFVAELDTGAGTFRIGTQLVDYGSATLADFGARALADGQFVDVDGDTIDGSGVLLAARVELEVGEDGRDDDLFGDDDDGFEFEGLITAVDGDEVTLGAGFTVRIAQDASFEDGGRSDLVVGARVELEGEVDAQGLPVATSVDFRESIDSEFEGRITALDPDAGTFAFLGLTVRVSATTQFEDDSDAAVRRFSLDDLGVGDFVEVRGAYENGVLTALRVERDDDDDGDDSDDDVDVEVEGTVEALSDVSIEVRGLTFAIDGGTRFEIDDEDVSREAFLAAAAVGDPVEVDGRPAGDGSLVAVGIELDD
jgi:hypothetical protein